MLEVRENMCLAITCMCLPAHSHTHTHIQAAGIRLGTLLETLTGLLMSIIIAFVYSWLVTLVILGILPVTIIAAAFNTRLITNNAERSQESLQAAQEVCQM